MFLSGAPERQRGATKTCLAYVFLKFERAIGAATFPQFGGARNILRKRG